jgi:protein phosphatase
VSDDDIAATLRAGSDVDSCAARLVELALKGGAPDNVTVVVADVVAEPRPADAELLLGR